MTDWSTNMLFLALLGCVVAFIVAMPSVAKPQERSQQRDDEPPLRRTDVRPTTAGRKDGSSAFRRR